MLVKLKAIFMRNIPFQVDQLKAFLDAGDTNATEKAAHTIMGSSAMLGAGAMSYEAGMIEQNSITGDIASARLHFARFAEEYEKVMVELSAEGGA